MKGTRLYALLALAVFLPLQVMAATSFTLTTSAWQDLDTIPGAGTLQCSSSTDAPIFHTYSSGAPSSGVPGIKVFIKQNELQFFAPSPDGMMHSWVKSADTSRDVVCQRGSNAAARGSSSDPVFGTDAALVDLGDCQVLVTSTAQTFAQLLSAASCPAIASARLVYTQPEIGDVRFRSDGVAPTSAIGSRIYPGVDYPILSSPLTNVRLISISGVSVTVNLRFYQ